MTLARRPALAAVLGAPHLVVDASSNFVMMILLRPAPPSRVMTLLVAYNFAAFALQPLIGLASDRLRQPRTVMCLGLLLVAAAMLVLEGPFWWPLALTGLGNALFHVGAGTIASVATTGRASGPGLFIAPGAIGVALGVVAGRSAPWAFWPIFVTLLGFAVLGARVPSPEPPQVREAPPTEGAGAILSMLLLAIAIRSLLGLRVVGALSAHASWVVPLAAAAFAGKALGGVAADLAGWKRTAVGCLLVSSVLLVFADRGAWVAAAALLCFQGVTAITLGALYVVLPGRISLCFGLACLALFVGGLPPLLHVGLPTLGPVPPEPLLAVVSALAVWRALALLERTSARTRGAAVVSTAQP